MPSQHQSRQPSATEGHPPAYPMSTGSSNSQHRSWPGAFPPKYTLRQSSESNSNDAISEELRQSTVGRESQEKTEDGSNAGERETLWVAKRTGPEFMGSIRNTSPIALKGKKGQSAWIAIPTSFTQLMSIFEDPKYCNPLWYRIPGVIDFPQFAGYYWMHNRRVPYSSDCLNVDQGLFSTIVRAACRTGRPPVCAPDYFYYDVNSKTNELKAMFRRRSMVPGIEWDLEPSKKGDEFYKDWERLCDYVRENVRMGEFLFEAPKQWDEKWFARLVMEKSTGDNIPVRREIVKFVAAQGMLVTFPRRRGFCFCLKRKWTPADQAIIRQAAERYWMDWREEVEDEMG